MLISERENRVQGQVNQARSCPHRLLCDTSIQNRVTWFDPESALIWRYAQKFCFTVRRNTASNEGIVCFKEMRNQKQLFSERHALNVRILFIGLPYHRWI